MTAKDNGHVVEFRKSLADWTDERMITRQQLDDLAMFFLYLVNLADEDGWVYDGHSMKMAATVCCLTVRSTIDGIPHVVFSSGRTPTACVRAFLRKMDEGWLEWVVDKFR